MKRKICALAAAFLLMTACSGAVSAAGELIMERAVLGGTILSVAAAGTKVQEGEMLAAVDTLAGPVPAAKATADGTVREVRAEPGQKVERAEIIAVLEKE